MIERDVAVPMRDGAVLRADVYRPDTDAPVPAIVNRTPYNRSSPLIPPAAMDPERAIEAGFALVCQDVRGRFGSPGDFYPFKYEAQDGYDTVEWAAAQPWCSGAVGMAGRSYSGAAQWMAAAEQPPHLKALFPVAIGSDYYDGWIYQGGAFQLGFNLFWALIVGAPREAAKAATHFKHLPLATVPALNALRPTVDFYFDWLAHATNDGFWRQFSIPLTYPRVAVPAYNVGGWYDVFLGGTLENFRRMRQEGGSPLARAGQKLLIGPWGHGSTFGTYPDHSYPPFASGAPLDVGEEQLRFYARYLRDERNGVDEGPPIRLFVMGSNVWRDENEWPLARTRYTPFYLRAGAPGAHELTPELPGDEAPDTYVYDPNNPAPTVGGSTSMPAMLFGTNSGPLDQRKVEARPDVLVYTSGPMQEPMEVTGPLKLRLFAATDARDTDFVAKLTDVDPDGGSRLLAEGVLRARYREGFEEARLVEPGAVLAYDIDLVATSHVFLNGHRVRLAITSSSFPRFDRNANTGNPLGSDGPEDLRAARQTIFHDRERPSHIVLPVIPG